MMSDEQAAPETKGVSVESPAGEADFNSYA